MLAPQTTQCILYLCTSPAAEWVFPNSHIRSAINRKEHSVAYNEVYAVKLGETSSYICELLCQFYD